MEGTVKQHANLVKWRRLKIMDYLAQGISQADIATELKVTAGTITNDIVYLRKQAKENIRTHIKERMPLEFETSLTSLKSVRRRANRIAEKTENERVKIMSLSLVRETEESIMDLISNGGIAAGALEYVTGKEQELESLLGEVEEAPTTESEDASRQSEARSNRNKSEQDSEQLHEPAKV